MKQEPPLRQIFCWHAITILWSSTSLFDLYSFELEEEEAVTLTFTVAGGKEGEVVVDVDGVPFYFTEFFVLKNKLVS